MDNLAGKVVAITGAASGIGRALALELAQRGSHLAVSDIDEEGLAKTRDDAAEHGITITSQRLDVADREAVYAWADQVVADHGRVNVIVNNAGVSLTGTLEELGYDDLEWIMGINFWGVVYGTKAFLPHLRESGAGHIVNVSSVFGMIGVPTQGAYNAAKFAVRGFTECLRQELKMDKAPVSATCVQPGGIRTNIARAARMRGKLAARRERLVGNFERAARTTPEVAAQRIVEGILSDERRVLIGADARLIDMIQRIMPTRYEAITRALSRRGT